MIRPARSSDAAAIAVIWNQIIRDTVATFTTAEKSPAGLAEAITQQPFVVAEKNSELLGFATYFAFRSGPGYAHTREFSIHLTPDARGRGLGSDLLQQLESHARQQGIHSLIAGISGENQAAIAFHSKLGFSETARLPQVGRKFERWHDLVLMQKFL